MQLSFPPLHEHIARISLNCSNKKALAFPGRESQRPVEKNPRHLIPLACERARTDNIRSPMSVKSNVFWLPASNLLSRLPNRKISRWLVGFRDACAKRISVRPSRLAPGTRLSGYRGATASDSHGLPFASSHKNFKERKQAIKTFSNCRLNVKRKKSNGKFWGLSCPIQLCIMFRLAWIWLGIAGESRLI
jgi:hypothetical protein